MIENLEDALASAFPLVTIDRAMIDELGALWHVYDYAEQQDQARARARDGCTSIRCCSSSRAMIAALARGHAMLSAGRQR
jgi:hypothetical protein